EGLRAGQAVVIGPVRLVEVGQGGREGVPLGADELYRLGQAGRGERAAGERGRDERVLAAEQLAAATQRDQRARLAEEPVVGDAHVRVEQQERGVQDLVVAVQRGDR